jgi:hypothetical protein
MGFTNPYANKRIPEMLEIIRACDQLKREEYFSEKVCAELTRPRAEHVLERTAAGGWAVSPMQFGPPRVLVARRAGSDEVRFQNPYAEQRPWLRLRACTRLAPYGAKENVVLADFGGAVPFKVADAAAPALVQSVSASSEKTPDGSSAFCYRAENKAKARSGWCRTSLEFPKTIDLSTHRRLGVWVKSEGKGGILNVQLAQGYGARDHYIPLDFKGWTYRALDPPEDARYYEYRWPYSMIDLMYWVFQYSSVKGINLYYNDLPPNAEVSCLIGRIEALCESPSPVKSPALEAGGQKMTFPGSLRPDEYIELDWTGKCRHFDPNGGLLADVNPQGTLRLAPGVNSVRFSGEGGEVASPRAELTLAVKGAALENQAKAARRPFRAEHPEDSEGLKLLPGGKGGFRLMQGLYELVGRETVQNVSVFDGKANAWTVENDQKTPCRGAVIIECAGSGVDADYNSPGGLLLEDFEDLRAYEMSERNQFEKYVIGGEKQIAPCGPVRAGVSQKFASSAEGAKAGRSCGVYSATNEGGAGGWCAKGKRFPEVLDLARYEAVALWVCGDGQRESLRLQFRDVTGKFADWLTPMDFTGWQLLVFRTADAKDFDWKKVEYVIFYYNGIPAKAAVTMKFDDLKALPKLRKAPKLSEPVLSVNGKPVEFHVSLHPGESLTTDGLGGCTVWEAGMKVRKRRHVPDSAFVLQPGPNRFDLSCDAGNGVPREVVCRVLRLGPAE